ALAACERAFALAASSENRVALAAVLVGVDSRLANLPRARELLEKALADADDKELALPLLCQVCGLQDDRPCLRRCVAELETVDPDALSTAYFATISAALDERWAEAQVAVERAHKAGLPEDEYARLKTEIAKHAPSPLWGLAAWVGSLWLGGL